jgi:hypothetical protein
MRVARLFSRRRWVSTTVSKSRWAMSGNCHRGTAFSKRESGGCKGHGPARDRIAIDEQLWIASAASRAASLQSA